jgi:hypothetical protein
MAEPICKTTETIASKTEVVHNHVKQSRVNGDNEIQAGSLSQLYANNGVFKIWKTATEHLEDEVRLALTIAFTRKHHNSTSKS